MTKGFITLATGNIRYFKMATNLLKSYKSFSKNPLPFAILTDRHNKFTAQFDEVIILENAKSSYMDKLSIIINCPFDETIFIDADCLAFQDLNQYWDIYDFSKTLTSFGTANALDFQEGWFKQEDIGIYKNSIKFIPNMHGGCYFINKNKNNQEFYNCALEISRNYHNYKFKYFDQPADEPIIALCMAIFDCDPIETKSKNVLVFFPAVTEFKSNLLVGYNSYIKNGRNFENAILVHWQNFVTKTAIYKTEVNKLNFLYKTLKLKEPAVNFKKGQLKTEWLLEIEIKNLLYKTIDFWENFAISLKKEIKQFLK